MGIPVRSSTSSATTAPASACPRNPCSGEKMAVTLAPFSTSRSSTCRWSFPTSPVWLLNNATRFPLIRGKYSSVRSSPVTTRPQRLPNAGSSITNNVSILVFIVRILQYLSCCCLCLPVLCLIDYNLVLLHVNKLFRRQSYNFFPYLRHHLQFICNQNPILRGWPFSSLSLSQ